MPRRLQPPSPIGQDHRTWALQLTNYLQDLTGDDDETAPRVSLLAHQVPARQPSARAAGAMMYDPMIQAPVVANGTEWHRVLTSRPLLSNANCVTVSATDYSSIPDATLRALGLAVQEIIARLDDLERR